MIDLKDVLLMPVAGGLLSQRTRRDSAAAVAAPSLPSVQMPGAAQDVAGQSSAGIRPQILAVALNALNSNGMNHRGSVGTKLGITASKVRRILPSAEVAALFGSGNPGQKTR